MAYVSNDQEDEENQPGQNASQGPVSPGGGGSAVHLAPTSGVGSTGASAGAPSANGTPAAGGSFATLDKYVGANQGQAEGLANTVTKGIGDQYNSLNSANQSTLGGIQNNVNSAYTPQDTGVLSAEAADPVSFASNPSNISSFQKQLNDQYTGPTSAESDAGYQKQQADINNAISEGNASTQTEAGRAGLLQQSEAAPTRGVTSLNSAILSQDPNAQGKIENAYQPFSNLLTGLSTGAQGIDQSIGAAQQQAPAAAAAANAQIAKQAADLGSGLNTGYNTALTNQQNYNKLVSTDQGSANSLNAQLLQAQQKDAAAINNAGYSDNATAAAAKAYGQTQLDNVLSPQFASLQPWLSNGLTQVSAPTQANTATAQQYATDAALGKLAGPSYSPLLNPAEASSAGTYSTPTAPAAFDSSGIANASTEANDLGTVLSTPGFNWSDPGALGASFSGMTPQQLATTINQRLTAQGPQQTGGLANNKDYMAALQQLINNNFGS